MEPRRKPQLSQGTARPQHPSRCWQARCGSSCTGDTGLPALGVGQRCAAHGPQEDRKGEHQRRQAMKPLVEVVVTKKTVITERVIVGDKWIFVAGS